MTSRQIFFLLLIFKDRAKLWRDEGDLVQGGGGSIKTWEMKLSARWDIMADSTNFLSNLMTPFGSNSQLVIIILLYWILFLWFLFFYNYGYKNINIVLFMLVLRHVGGDQISTAQKRNIDIDIRKNIVITRLTHVLLNRGPSTTSTMCFFINSNIFRWSYRVSWCHDKWVSEY